jgi:hypothetical protein
VGDDAKKKLRRPAWIFDESKHMPLAERGLGVTFQTGCLFRAKPEMLIVMSNQFNLDGANGHS